MTDTVKMKLAFKIVFLVREMVNIQFKVAAPSNDEASTLKSTCAPRVSATEPDWTREEPRKFWDPSRKLLRAIRRFQALQNKYGIAVWIARQYWKRVHQFWCLVSQNEIQLRTNIGGGLLLPHPNGIVIHPDAVLGPNCLIFNQVTIGIGKAGPDGRHTPIIGGHVDIAAGARIVGGIRIGNHAVIGLNAVVISDVPDGGVAVGVPARVVRIAPPFDQDQPL